MPLEPNEAQATFVNTEPEFAAANNGKTELEDWEKTVATFNSSSNFNQNIKVDFDQEIYGLKSYAYTFHRSDGTDFEKYNGFNFTSPSIWDATNQDSFWYNWNTTILFYTDHWRIGQEQLEVVSVELIPELEIKIDKEVTSSLFGIPLSTGDVK